MLADLPWASQSVSLQLLIRRFFCFNHSCARKVFTERFGDWWPKDSHHISDKDCAAVFVAPRTSYFLASDLERIASLPEGVANATALGALAARDQAVHLAAESHGAVQR